VVKKTPQNPMVATSELLRRLTNEEFEELRRVMAVRIRRIKMKTSVIEGGKSKKEPTR
jgi:hypothetical protein